MLESISRQDTKTPEASSHAKSSSEEARGAFLDFLAFLILVPHSETYGGFTMKIMLYADWITSAGVSHAAFLMMESQKGSTSPNKHKWRPEGAPTL